MESIILYIIHFFQQMYKHTKQVHHNEPLLPNMNKRISEFGPDFSNYQH